MHQVFAAAELPVQERRGGQRADPVLAEDGEAHRVRDHSVHTGIQCIFTVILTLSTYSTHWYSTYLHCYSASLQ